MKTFNSDVAPQACRMLRQEGSEALQNNTMHMQQYVVPTGLGYPDGGSYQPQWSDNFSVGGNFVPPQGSGPSGGGGQPMRMHHQTIQVTTTQGPAQPTPTSTPPGPPVDMKPGSHMQPQPPQMSQGVAPMVVQQPQPRPPASAQSFAPAHNYQSTRVTSQRITSQRPVLGNIPHVQYPTHVVPVVPVPSSSQHVIIQPVSPMTMSYQGQNRNQNQNQLPAYYTAPPHYGVQPQAFYPNPQNTQFFLRYLNQGNVTPQQQNAQQNQMGPAGFSNSGSMLQSAQAQGTGCPQDKFRRRTNAVPIIDPETGKSIFDNEPSSSNNTPSRSSESSARETPQPSSVHTPDDKTMAADFAARVAKVAADVSVTEISNGQPQLENISDQPSDSDILHKTHIVPSNEIKINPTVLPTAIKADTDFVQRTGNDQTTRVTQEEQESRDESPPLLVTPTVSAVTSVETHRDRQNKEQFPAVAKSTQSSGTSQPSQSPVRTNSRKQRSSESEKQSSSVQSNAISSVSVGAPISSVDASATNKKSQKSLQKDESYAPPKERREKSRSLSKEQSPPVVTDEVTTVPASATTLLQPNIKSATQVSSFQESVSIKTIPTVVPHLSSSTQSVLQVEEKVSPPPVKQANGEAHTDIPIEGKQPAQQHRGKNKRNAKMRGDLNKRGVEKEGTDMDAFTESSIPVEERDRVSPVPAQSNNKMGAQTLPAQVPPPLNEQIMDELENQEEKIVAAKNEENAKVSVVQQVQNEKSENEPPPAVIEKPIIPLMALKHSYKEDQWSPVNPEGKKKYERDFLLELQNEPQSRKKPENLPDVEAVLKDTSNRRAQGSMSFQVNRNQDTFIPGFAKSNSQRGVIGKRGSQQGKIKPSKPNVIHMSLSLHEDVKLKETENAWKPSRLIQNEITEEEKDTQELFKKVRGILNKLTPQKFDTLTLQLRHLPINSLPRLQGVIDLIFEKAVDEPNFSKAYAHMCKILQMLEVQHNKETVKFRNLLITRCQHEFEGNKAAEIDAEKRLEQIRNCTDPEKKKELQVNLEEEERRIRMKSVGNIRFIGELFKLNMLTATIMLRCIDHLLANEEEESLECLCKLLTTIGKDLESTGTKDNPKLGAETLQSVFQRMSVLAQKRDNSKISSRVRFMLQDVIELRQKNWVPRREDNNPKTIDQIQKEAERETMEMNIALSQPRNKIHDSRQDSDRKGRGNRSNNPNDENWQTVTSNKSYRSNSFFETSRLQCVKDDMNITSLGSSNQFRNFVPGGGTKGSDNKQENKSFFGQNLYQCLLKPSPSDERKSQSSMLNSNRKLTPSPSLEKERFYAHPKDSNEGGQISRGSSLQRERQQLSQPPSRDSSVSRSNIAPSMQSRQPSALPELTEEQIKRKTKNIFEEYVSLHNIQESRTCIEEAFTNVNIDRFLRSVLDMVTECKNSQMRGEIGKFISELMGLNVISKQLFIDELSNMFECSEDVAIDVPLFWDYLAELIVPALSEDQITFADIRTAGSSFIKTPTAGKLLKPLFKLLVKEKDQEFVRSRMGSSKITLEDFLPVPDVENFIKQNGLEYLREGSTSGALTINQIQKQILEYARSNKTYDEITDWITAHVGEKVNSTQFIRALITAISEASVNSNKHLDKAKFKSFANLIFRYCSSLEEYELAGLNAIQAFVTKLEHPSGLLMDIFHILWEDNMFSNESFLKWRDGEETEGKGVCVKSLTSFFVALSESYSEDETS